MELVYDFHDRIILKKVRPGVLGMAYLNPTELYSVRGIDSTNVDAE